jgi:putative spermidine/putrescine transport system permease protein
LGKIGLIDEYTQFPDFIYSWNGAAVVFAYVYKEIPFVMLMVLSVLKNFDRNQIITAKMLGGKEVRIFVKVVLPFLLPIIHTLFVILFVYSFGAFDIPFILGKSSPSMMSVKIFRLYFMRDISARPESLAALAFVLIFSVLSIYLYFRIMRLIGLKDRGIL